MKKIKNWFIWVVVVALLCGAVAVFSIGNDDDEPVKDNNIDNVVDTEQEPDLPVTNVIYCDCVTCAIDRFYMEGAYYIVDGHLGVHWLEDYQGSVTRLSSDELYVGREVTLVSQGCFYMGTTIDGADARFTMDPGECFEILLGETLCFWLHHA